MARVTRVFSIAEIDAGYKQPIFVSSDPQLLEQVANLLAARLATAPQATTRPTTPRPVRAVPDHLGVKKAPSSTTTSEDPD